MSDGPRDARRSGSGRVSVVIPTFNESDHLGRSIPALVSQRDPNHEFEILVVDDGSTDDTVRVAESLGARVLPHGRNAGPSSARNRGAKAARGEYLLFVDADVVVHRGAVARMASFLDDNPAVAAVIGSYDTDPQAPGVLTQYKNLLHHFVHQNGSRRAATFWSGCGAIRRNVFLAIGGFDERGYPRCIEDIELGYRLRAAGHEIVLDRDLQCTHLKRWTLCSWIRTDVFCRAIPWTGLNLRHGSAPNDLNIATSQRLSVFLTLAAAGLLISAALHPVGALLATLAVLAVVALNYRLFGFFLRVRGPWFALCCVPLHLLYFLYSGIGFAYAWLMFRLGRRAYDWNAPRG